jgi:hypothetical protein
MSKTLRLSFTAMTHLAEGLCLNALLTLKVPTVPMMEWQFILPFKTLIKSKASRYRLE